MNRINRIDRIKTENNLVNPANPVQNSYHQAKAGLVELAGEGEVGRGGATGPAFPSTGPSSGSACTQDRPRRRAGSALRRQHHHNCHPASFPLYSAPNLYKSGFSMNVERVLKATLFILIQALIAILKSV